jgi:hypothetical protein
VSYYLAASIALLALFGLGAFLDHISREGMLLAGIKMILAGLVAVVLSYLIQNLLHPQALTHYLHFSRIVIHYLVYPHMRIYTQVR